MNFANWYTDTFDVYRETSTTVNNLASNSRNLLYTGVYGRIFNTSSKSPSMKQTAADVTRDLKLACDNSVDIRAGDELIITRGGKLGQNTQKMRAFAGEPNQYYEPFGGVVPRLDHQEIPLLNQERID